MREWRNRRNADKMWALSVTQSREGQQNRDAIAAEWVARMAGSPLSEGERRILCGWLRESPAHRAAFDEARLAWEKMGQLGPLGEDAFMVRKSGKARRDSFFSQGRVAAMAACLAVVLCCAMAWWFGNPMLMLAADCRTAPGEQRTVRLTDGSQVRLGPASAIALHYDQDERRVELLSGRADFTVAPMTGTETRPFVVTAAAGRAKALGTRFMVNRIQGGAEVTVLEHDVEVSVPGEAGIPVRAVVSPGQSVRYQRREMSRVRSVNPDLAMAWTEGTLVFDHAPLQDVVAELGRYRHGRIMIADLTLASRPVSGVFETQDPDAALATIIRVLGVRSASLPSVAVVLF